MPDKSQSPLSAPLVGDDLALDFINTRYGTGAALRECLVDDASVVAWLKQVDVLPAGFSGAPEGLLALALKLRENASLLVGAAKTGEGADAGVVNNVLEDGRASRELRWDVTSKSFQAITQRRYDDPASLLEPVAQAVMDLLTKTSMDLVRQCEAYDCTLMFRDTTKSHRRRWCSMALCGNRMKVAAFRLRKRVD